MELTVPLGSLKKILVVSSSLLLTACLGSNKKIEISTAPVATQVIHPEFPRPVKLDNVTFKVVTSENLEEFLKQWKQKNGDDFVFIAFSVKDYETMAINFEELRRYINQQKEIIIYYRKATSYEEPKPADGLSTP
jgi:hypothetical protein